MKKYKHGTIVSGSTPLIKAFEQMLIDNGFTKYTGDPEWSTLTADTTGVVLATLTQGQYTFGYEGKFSKDFIGHRFKLPYQWDEAFTDATVPFDGIEVGRWQLDEESGRFGCVKITPEIIRFLREVAYNTEVIIGGTQITRQILDKVASKLPQ